MVKWKRSYAQTIVSIPAATRDEAISCTPLIPAHNLRLVRTGPFVRIREALVLRPWILSNLAQSATRWSDGSCMGFSRRAG